MAVPARSNDSQSPQRVERQRTNEPPRRRKRGTLVDPVPLGWAVERPTKERIDALARNAGVSSAVMLEHIVANLVVSDRGLPATWPDPPLKDGELPIDTA